MTVKWDYSPWGSVIEYRSVEHFEGLTSLPNGVHRVALEDGSFLEMLAAGDPLVAEEGMSIPLFFSGALSSRSGTSGPYFSGKGMGAALKRGYLAFSDPSFVEDEEIGLGWYLGMPGAQVQEAMQRMVEAISRLSGRRILAIGGSGGGFAALALAQIAPSVTAFVWNPQTNVLNYVPSVVQKYLSVAFPDTDWTQPCWRDQAEITLRAAGMHFCLTDKPVPGSYLYLQNHDDWHLLRHLAPWMDAYSPEYRGRGYYSGSRQQGILVGAFGEGHAVPDSGLLQRCIEMLIETGGDAWLTNAALNAESLLDAASFAELPTDLRTSASEAADGLEVRLIPAGQDLRCEVAAGNGRFPGVSAQVYAYSHDERLGASYQERVPMQWVVPAETETVIVSVRDAFGHVLGQRRIERTDVDDLLPMFVYGSCVTRDAFEFEGAPELAGYVARSSVASAMSNLSTGLEHEDLSANPSAFQRRMVQLDLTRGLSDMLANTAFSFLVVDFIDERFALAQAGNGALFSISPELVSAGIDVADLGRVESGSSEHLEAFRMGWRKLVDLVGESRIIVNKVYWAAVDERGIPTGDPIRLRQANSTLDELYAIVELESPGVRWVTYGEGAFVGDSSHKWGLSPFHFGSSLYMQTVAQLDAHASHRERTLVFTETMFCDYEQDPEVRERYLTRWLLSLRQMHEVHIPQGVHHVALLYVSRDKQIELEKVRQLLCELGEREHQEFRIVEYSHPEAGYGLEGAKHPDLVKNPNKHAPRRNALFELALTEIDLQRFDRFIRVGIDDDDFWLPWQLDEIVHIAREHVRPDEFAAVGMTRFVAAYMEEGVADHVDTSRCMTGNKFYVAPKSCFSQLRTTSPWGLPEIFDEEAAQRFARTGISLRSVSDHRAGWVYGRWGANLTVAHKDPYYLQKFGSMTFDSVDSMLRDLSVALPGEST